MVKKNTKSMNNTKKSRLIKNKIEGVFSTNFLAEHEHLYRKAISKFNVEDKFKIVDEAYDESGRRLEYMKALYTLFKDDRCTSYEIYKEVKKQIYRSIGVPDISNVKVLGISDKKFEDIEYNIDETKESTSICITNFPDYECHCYIAGLKILNIEDGFKIYDTAYDYRNNILKGFKSLHCIDENFRKYINDLFEEVKSIKEINLSYGIV